MSSFSTNKNDYIKYGKENKIDGQWEKQLENASARFHISRLETLKLQTQQLELLFGNQLDSNVSSSGRKAACIRRLKKAGMFYVHAIFV